MAPVPPEKPRRSRPTLHLECLDVSHDGCRAFFEHAPRPEKLLDEAVSAVLDALYHDVGQTAPPPVRRILLKLHDFEGVAYTCSSELDPLHKEIHLSMSYVAGVARRARSAGTPDHIGLEIRGVVTHEMVHGFQYNGKGTMPGGVIEGIADWVRQRAGVGAPHWRRERPADDAPWDAGYEKTGFFLEWLSKRLGKPDLVPLLNQEMKGAEWDNGAVLQRLLDGKEVGELFREYRNSFSRSDDATGERGPPRPVPTHAA